MAASHVRTPPPPGEIRVAVVGDQRVLLTPLTHWLRRQEHITTVAELTDWTAPLTSVVMPFNVVVLDTDTSDSTPVAHKVDTLSSTGIRVIVLAGTQAPAVTVLLDAGATAVLSKDEPITTLLPLSTTESDGQFVSHTLNGVTGHQMRLL